MNPNDPLYKLFQAKDAADKEQAAKERKNMDTLNKTLRLLLQAMNVSQPTIEQNRWEVEFGGVPVTVTLLDMGRDSLWLWADMLNENAWDDLQAIPEGYMMKGKLRVHVQEDYVKVEAPIYYPIWKAAISYNYAKAAQHVNIAGRADAAKFLRIAAALATAIETVVVAFKEQAAKDYATLAEQSPPHTPVDYLMTALEDVISEMGFTRE